MIRTRTRFRNGSSNIPWYLSGSIKADSNLPSLVLDFQNGRYALNSLPTSLLTTDANSPISRSTTATYVNASGVVLTAAINQKRYQGGLPLTEAAATNICLQSESFDNAVWTKFNCTVVADAITAPDGTTTADTFTGSGAFGGAYQAIAVTPSTNYVMSLWVKLGTAAATDLLFAFYNATAGSFISQDLTPLGKTPNASEWTRLYYTVTTPAGCTSMRIYPLRAAVPSGATLYLWGCQLEAGTLPTSYIPTTTASVTRAADVLTPLAIFSRPSLATYIDNSGVLKYAQTNLIASSEDASTWSPTVNASITANSIVAPDGTTTADTITQTPAATAYCGPLINYLAGKSYVHSSYVKAGTESLVTILLYGSSFNGGGSNITATFNISTGVVSSVSATPPSAYGIEASANGFYRIWVAHTCTASSVARQQPLRFGSTTIGNYLYAWGMQIEIGTSPSSYIKTTGSVKSTLRLDYSNGYGSALLEGAATNLMTDSEIISGWTPTNTTISANISVAPDGTMTADSLVPTAVSGSHLAQKSSVALLTAGTPYTYSIYAKANGYNYIELYFSAAAFPTFQALRINLADLSTQTLNGSPTGGGQYVGNGWYRVWVTATPTVSDYANVQVRCSPNSSTFTGDGVSGAYVWGAQVEAAKRPTSYIPAGTATVTRAADSLVINTSVADYYGGTAGTLWADAYQSSSDTTNVLCVASMDDNTANNQIKLGVDGATNLARSYMSTGGVAQADISSGSYPVNTFIKSVVAFAANDIQAAGAGTLGTADTSASLPTMTQLQLGNCPTSNYLYGGIKQLRFYNIRVTNDELQRITT